MPGETGLPVLVVFGPTASGKTALAGSLFAETDSSLPQGVDGRFRGKAEIISADSMQVYRGMDIGTAKPSSSFLKTLPHHLIDIRNPDEQFCAGDFVRLADAACRDIAARGKLPVVLGGTAFYIKNFLFGLPETPESDPSLRTEILERMKTDGPEVLMAELREKDPESAARIHPNDEYRIARALEVFYASGRPLASFSLPTEFRRDFRFRAVALERDRAELNARIDARVDEMIESGLEAEFQALARAGYGSDAPGMQAIGYREFFSGGDERTVRESIKNDSRKYAKRQETFIKPMAGVIRLPADDIAHFFAIVRDFQEGSAD
jgi:tRNA dimethylallyltransferase